jgi:hypothetical protein
MISIQEAREILQDDQMSDKEVEEIINFLQLLVEFMFDVWVKDKKLNQITPCPIKIQE